MSHFKIIEKCRVCGSHDLTEVIHIEEQFLSPTFVKTNKNNKLSKLMVSQTLVLCDKEKNPEGCGLLQLKETVKPDLLYKNYFYRSAINDTMRRDLREVVDDATSRVDLEAGDYIIDIGANDCTMVQYFSDSLNRIAVEPAENIDWSDVDKSVKIVNNYFSKDATGPALDLNKAKLITACAMFYDLDDPNSFVSDIKDIMHPEGLFCVQLSYLPGMLTNVNFYDICNEHLEYYSLHTLKELFSRHDLRIVHASENEVNGGSIRIFVAHEDSSYSPTAEFNKLFLMEETDYSLDSVKTYQDFQIKIDFLRDKVKEAMLKEINGGNLVIGLGASTKGNMLLQLFGINKNMMPYISERNPEKVGLKTLGTDIPLISEEEARSLNPSCMLVMPWYFKDEIVKREQEYINSGGKLLFPMPYPHLVTKDGEIILK